MTTGATFDIRTAQGRRDLAIDHIESGRPRDDALSVDEVRSGLEGLSAHLGPRDWMVWQWGGFRVPTGGRSSMLMNAGQAAELGNDLARLSSSVGFEFLLGGFRNPTQFQDSMFEARIAGWCLGRPAVRRVRFGGKYSVLGHTKQPDFEALTPIGWIVCECKRLHVESLDLSGRLTSITNAFDRALRSVDIGTDVRLQVEVVRRIDGDLDTQAVAACTAATAGPLGVPVPFGPFVLIRSVIGSPPVPHNARHVWQGRVTVGSTPTGITEEFSYLLVSSPRMEQALLRAVGSLINTAHRQLPQDRDGIIFIEGPGSVGQAAAAVRLLRPEYAHCLAVGFVGPHELNFSRRSVDERLVDWVFLDRVPRLADRVRELVLRRTGAHRLLLDRGLRKPTLRNSGLVER